MGRTRHNDTRSWITVRLRLVAGGLPLDGNRARPNHHLSSATQRQRWADASVFEKTHYAPHCLAEQIGLLSYLGWCSDCMLRQTLTPVSRYPWWSLDNRRRCRVSWSSSEPTLTMPQLSADNLCRRPNVSPRNHDMGRIKCARMWSLDSVSRDDNMLWTARPRPVYDYATPTVCQATMPRGRTIMTWQVWWNC